MIVNYINWLLLMCFYCLLFILINVLFCGFIVFSELCFYICTVLFHSLDVGIKLPLVDLCFCFVIRQQRVFLILCYLILSFYYYIWNLHPTDPITWHLHPGDFGYIWNLHSKYLSYIMTPTFQGHQLQDTYIPKTSATWHLHSQALYHMTPTFQGPQLLLTPTFQELHLYDT